MRWKNAEKYCKLQSIEGLYAKLEFIINDVSRVSKLLKEILGYKVHLASVQVKFYFLHKHILGMVYVDICLTLSWLAFFCLIYVGGVGGQIPPTLVSQMHIQGCVAHISGPTF